MRNSLQCVPDASSWLDVVALYCDGILAPLGWPVRTSHAAAGEKADTAKCGYGTALGLLGQDDAYARWLMALMSDEMSGMVQG
jgi:hypothetical protein